MIEAIRKYLLNCLAIECDPNNFFLICEVLEVEEISRCVAFFSHPTRLFQTMEENASIHYVYRVRLEKGLDFSKVVL